MSDAVDYFRSYAARAICKARRMPFGRLKRTQRAVGHIYHLLTKEASFAPNVHHLSDFRAAQKLEKLIDETSRPEKRNKVDGPRADATASANSDVGGGLLQS
jgi:hypothetical protein